MFDFDVSSDQAVLDLNLDKLDLGLALDSICLHNSPRFPAETIYLILPTKSPAAKELYWNTTTSLTGPPADLIILTQSDLTIMDMDFRSFRNVLVSDNRFHHDASSLLVIKEDEFQGCKITFANCQANNAYFLCNSLKWLGGKVTDDLFVKLHGHNQDLQIEGEGSKRAVIGNLIIPEGAKPERVTIKNAAISRNFTCEGAQTLSISDLKSGSGVCRLIAHEIEELSNFRNLGETVIIKAEIANIGTILVPRGKVQIDVNAFIDFKADDDGNFKGFDLNIDVSRAIEKAVKLPYPKVYFDRVNIKGASLLDIAGNLCAKEVFFLDCLKVKLAETSVGYLKYQVAKGDISFHAPVGKLSKIDSLFLLGNIDSIFIGPAEVTYFENDEGRCHLIIYDNFKAESVFLNLKLDPRKELFDSENQGYFGLLVRNKGDKLVEINNFLATLTTFNIDGSVNMGRVMFQPIDSKYNLIQVNVAYQRKIHIDEFFVSFEHVLVINKTNGKMSLQQSVDRAIKSGEILASVNFTSKEYITIRAREGLSFHGEITTIGGDIELFTLFGTLRVGGALKAAGQIRLLALEGSLDLSAVCNAVSLITYSGSDTYAHDLKVNAAKFLATAVGHYLVSDSVITSSEVAILSENDSLMIKASKLQTSILQAKAKEDVRVESSAMDAASQRYTGTNVYSTSSVITSRDIAFEAERDIGVVSSTLRSENIASRARSDIRYVYSQTSAQYLVNEADGDISIRASSAHAKEIHNRAGGDLEVASGSELVSQLATNYAGGSAVISDSSVYSALMLVDAQKKITVDSSLILSDHTIFFHAVANYLAINSNIILGQHPYKLFLHKTGEDSRGQPLVRCGFSLSGIEAIGLMGSKGYDYALTEFQYALVNSSGIDLGIFAYLSKENPKGIIIDAASGVIMGSNLSAQNHNVIIRAKHGIELLPLSFYNTVMFSGGFTPLATEVVISKIEAGLIDLDGGSLIKSVGALLRAAHGNLKADYIIDEPMLASIATKQRSLKELSIWLGGNGETYDLIVNNVVVPTRLEFSEVTKIDVGKGKVNLFYPYSSKEVHLRQRMGDVHIDRDVHFPYQVMALHLDEGKIFFGAPKTESFLLKFFGSKRVLQHETVEHVAVSGHNLHFSAAAGIEVHGTIDATGSVSMQSSSGSVKIAADKHNFGREVQQSIVRADNLFITGDNIEILGSLITVKKNLKLVSHNDIKVIPIELIHRYEAWHGSKTYSREMSITQVVSEINAGIINIDAGRAAEFIGSLIKAEELDIHASHLKILGAKEIFEKQVEFKGKQKWHGGRQSWSDYTYSETVIPTEMHVGKFRMLVDHDATIEASQIFVKDEVLTKVGGSLTIKDGYNLHIHDHHAKKYSLISFGGGSIKLHNTKSIRSLTEQMDGIPTMVCAGGIFYGVVDGTMHVLGSTILGKDIHLVVPNGLKLEASKYTDKSLIFVDETGAKLDFYCKNKQEAGIKVGAYATRDDESLWHQHLTQTVIAAQDTLNILVNNGTFEQISSQLAGKIIHVEARNWVAKTYSEETVYEHVHRHAEVGAKIAIKQTVTSALEKGKMLINKKGSHIIDNLDRVFKAYDTYKSFAALPSNAATGGSYAYLEASQSEELVRSGVAVDNTISGKTITARIKEDIRFQGVKMQARDVDIEATNFTFETSHDTHEREYDFGRVDIDIGISNPGLSTAGGSLSSSESSAVIHHHNYIKASGNLKIVISSDGKFKGVSIEGASVNVRAKNLILESVQDIIEKKLEGASFHIGLNQEYGIQGFGLSGEAGSGKSAWTKQMAQIIGTQVVNVVVKETLELAGGLIANAEEDARGRLTDKGNLSVNCGRLIIKNIHDYDQGQTLGIGASFQINQDTDGDSGVRFSHLPLKVQFKDQQRTVFGTIGQGSVSSGSISGDSLNRSVARLSEATRDESASFDAPIHADMVSTLTGNGGPKKPPTVKEIVRETTQEQTIPVMLANYFIDVADSFKGAVKDSIIAGAKSVNLLGGKIDTELLDQRMHGLLDWQYGSKLSSSEIRALEEAYNKELAARLQKVSEKENLDLGDEQQYKLAENKAKYSSFFEKLQDKVKDAGSNKPALTAAMQIYKTFYLKELKEAKEQGRAVKDFNVFIKDLNRNNIYSSSNFVEKIHPTIASILGEIELIFATHKVSQSPASKASAEIEIDRTVEIERVSDQSIDYTLLWLNRSKQEEVQLSQETIGLLSSLLQIDQKQSLSAHNSDSSLEEVAHSSNTVATQPYKKPSIVFSNQAYASSLIGYGPSLDFSWVPDITFYTALLRSSLSALRPLAAPIGGLATAISLELHSSQSYSRDLHRYTALALDNSQNVAITAVDYALANARGIFNPENPHDIEAWTLAARGIAIERSGSSSTQQLVPIWSAKKPINFKVMGRVDSQRNTLISHYFDLDPNAGKPSLEIFPAHQQPRSLMLPPYPDDRDTIIHWSQLPGFSSLPEAFVRSHDQSFPDQSDLTELMNILYKKQYPDSVEKINDRYPINGDLAGQKYPLPDDLQALYPDGIWIKDNGCPDFTPYADITVVVDGLTGDRITDDIKANRAAGLKETPDGKTWHHVEDGKTMQLVSRELHKKVHHTGGAALLKSKVR